MRGVAGLTITDAAVIFFLLVLLALAVPLLHASDNEGIPASIIAVTYDMQMLTIESPRRNIYGQLRVRIQLADCTMPEGLRVGDYVRFKRAQTTIGGANPVLVTLGNSFDSDDLKPFSCGRMKTITFVWEHQ